MATSGAKERLFQRLTGGEWQPGEELPSEGELAGQLDVSRATLHKAMQAAAAAGLIVTRAGRRARMADPIRRAPSEERTAARAVVTLEARIARALASERLVLDAVCLTSESLTTVLQRQLQELRINRRTLRELRLRLLISNLAGTPTFPRLVGAPNDRRPLDNLQWITQTQVASLKAVVQGLSTFQLVTGEASVEVRTVPFPPMSKLYLLNEREVLEGFYRVTERDVTIAGKAYLLDDLAGLDAEIFWRTASEQPDHVDTKFVLAAQGFFDSWWAKAAPYGVPLLRPTE